MYQRYVKQVSLSVRKALAFVGFKKKKNGGTLPERQNVFKIVNDSTDERMAKWLKA